MPEWLADTNVWLRSSEPAHPMYPAATNAVKTILGRQEEIYLVSQVVTEYWRVATAPFSQRGGFGWDPARADFEVQQIEYDFPMKADIPDVYVRWRTLVRSAGVSGAKVYDARLVAAMLAHGLTHILTFNVDDFRRYALWGIIAVSPDDV